MKPITELAKTAETTSSIARRAWMQKQIQQSCAIGLARWLMSIGEPVAPFTWSYERE